MSHFLLSRPITCLATGMISSANRTALISPRSLPDRFTTTNLGAVRAAVNLTVVARSADRDHAFAASAEKETERILRRRQEESRSIQKQLDKDCDSTAYWRQRFSNRVESREVQLCDGLHFLLGVTSTSSRAVLPRRSRAGDYRNA